jgi:hypothetical protein
MSTQKRARQLRRLNSRMPTLTSYPEDRMGNSFMPLGGDWCPWIFSSSPKW